MSEKNLIKNSIVAGKQCAEKGDISNALVHCFNLLEAIYEEKNITESNFEEIHTKSHQEFRKKGIKFYLKGCGIIGATYMALKYSKQIIDKFFMFLNMVF